jgi:hypothetical protein
MRVADRTYTAASEFISSYIVLCGRILEAFSTRRQ